MQIISEKNNKMLCIIYMLMTLSVVLAIDYMATTFSVFFIFFFNLAAFHSMVR